MDIPRCSYFIPPTIFYLSVWIEIMSAIFLFWSLAGLNLCCSSLVVIKHYPDSLCGFLQFRQAKTEIVTASKVAYRFLLGVTSNPTVTPESPSNSNRARFQSAWFKNLMSSTARPSSSSSIENQEDGVRQQQPLHEAEAPLRQT